MKIDLVTLQYVQLEMHRIKFLFFQITQTFRNLLNYASDASFCLTCLRTFVHNVPLYFRAYTSYALSCLRALRALFTHLIYTPCAPKNLFSMDFYSNRKFLFSKDYKRFYKRCCFYVGQKTAVKHLFFLFECFFTNIHDSRDSMGRGRVSI